MFQGLRTVIYGAKDIEQVKAWYSAVLGQQPYFDQPFYVGFNVGGYELRLSPNATPGSTGPVAYWGVPNADAAYQELIDRGALPDEPVHEVGDGIRLGTVVEANGAVIGIIENPQFSVGEQPSHDGPGR